MRSAELKRKTPLLPGSGFKPPTKPMARGTTRMRASKPKSAKPKRAARNTGPDYLAMCRGQQCYLQIHGVCNHDRATVVPAHSNQQRHGKGMAIKAMDIFTIPACACCHAEIDSGQRFTKAEKFALWDDAYERWAHDRENQLLQGCNDNTFPDQKM